MPTCLGFNNEIGFLIQRFKAVRNMQNRIETRGNLCTELGPPAFAVCMPHVQVNTLNYELIFYPVMNVS